MKGVNRIATLQVEEMQGKKKRKNPYIAHLAEFKFKPAHNWPIEEAHAMFAQASRGDRDVIYYKDCIAGMRNLPAGSVDLVIADPPFGLDFSGKEAMYNRDGEQVVQGYVEADGEYGEFTSRWVSELPRVMNEHASAYIFSGWTNLRQVLNALATTGLCLVNHAVWHYNFGIFTTKKFTTSHYHVLFLVKDPRKYFFHRVQHYNEDVWDIKRVYAPKQEKNGTKLPEELVQKCIDFSSKPGAIVLDPFMGNGTTAIVAKKHFRHYIGFELNARMRPIIDRGLQRVTLGEDYTPYWDRIPTIDELKTMYPHAYTEFLKRRQEEEV